MKTIGKVLKEARIGKKFSREKLEKETKIKKGFIEAIEKETWDELPDFPVVQGFIKSISRSLNVEKKKTLALLRRDYPPKELRVNPKPDISDKFTWSPKIAFFVGVGAVTILILGYLGYQYRQFISSPPLNVKNPKDGQVVEENTVTVSGNTSSDATVKVNNQLVLVDDSGDFSVEIEITKNTKEIVIKATSRSGKEALVRRKIEPNLSQ